jgi:hypothetical protein
LKGARWGTTTNDRHGGDCPTGIASRQTPWVTTMFGSRTRLLAELERKVILSFVPTITAFTHRHQNFASG